MSVWGYYINVKEDFCISARKWLTPFSLFLASIWNMVSIIASKFLVCTEYATGGGCCGDSDPICEFLLPLGCQSTYCVFKFQNKTWQKSLLCYVSESISSAAIAFWAQSLSEDFSIIQDQYRCEWVYCENLTSPFASCCPLHDSVV